MFHLRSVVRNVGIHPKEILSMIDTTPVTMVVAKLDAMPPPEEQMEQIEKSRRPKRLLIAKCERPLTVLGGDGSKEILLRQDS